MEFRLKRRRRVEQDVFVLDPSSGPRWYRPGAIAASDGI